jgi:hypothetical protein
MTGKTTTADQGLAAVSKRIFPIRILVLPVSAGRFPLPRWRHGPSNKRDKRQMNRQINRQIFCRHKEYSAQFVSVSH